MELNNLTYLYWEKNIINFNKYLVQYCQLNIYLQ